MRSQIVIPAPAKLLTHNKERSLHHMERASIVKLWRKSAMVWAQVTKVPKYESAEVSFIIEQAKGKLADPVSHSPVGKAIIDGLVDAKILRDDTGDYVTKVTYLPVIHGEKDQVTVGLIGELRDSETEEVEGLLLDFRTKKSAQVAKEQARCPHEKRLKRVCIECGAKT